MSPWGSGAEPPTPEDRAAWARGEGVEPGEFRTLPAPPPVAPAQRPEPVYVAQRDSWDCGVACLAMVSGRTYDAVLAGLGAQAVEGYRQTGGISTAHMPQLLGELGLATRTVFPRAEEWWTTPLTGLRLADVRGHYVVVLPDNTVLDPARGPGRAVADYANAFHLWEIHPVVSAPPPVAAREEDPFCPQHGPARASDHAAAGCTCRPDAREEEQGALLKEQYWCGCERFARWGRCEQHGDLDHDEEPPDQVAPPAPSPDVALNDLLQELTDAAGDRLLTEVVRWESALDYDPRPVAEIVRDILAAFAAQARRTEEAERDKYCVVETVVKQERELRALQQRLAAAEAKLAEAAEDLANATGGFDAAMGLADAEQERAKAAEERVRELEERLAEAESDTLREVGKQWQALNDEQFDYWLYVTKGAGR